ncbi:acetoacetate decarboxylase [Salinisphaera sp. PC39]|uniref:acetoacetate decarboxylase family protein n=1 Tax=Salinisphaera sp. PC39 TaxID=1304156 RepID=UPI003341419F
MSERDPSDLLMPLCSPPFGKLPFPMIECKMVLVAFKADPDEIARITPAPLEPDGDTLYAFVADNNQLSHSMAYHEAAILQKVTYQGRSAVTVPYIWTSTDTAMLAGRELFGMPKLMCDDAGHLHAIANEVSGSLVKYGRTMMDLGIVIDAPGTIADLPFGADWTFVRHIPSPDPKRPAIQQLLWIELQDFALQECWLGRGWLDISYPSSSGIDRFGASPVERAWYGRFSWELRGATVEREWELTEGNN